MGRDVSFPRGVNFGEEGGMDIIVYSLNFKKKWSMGLFSVTAFPDVLIIIINYYVYFADVLIIWVFCWCINYLGILLMY